MDNATGRPLSSVWSAFSSSPTEDHKLKASPCQHCNQTVKHHGKVQIVTDHMEVCPNFPHRDEASFVGKKRKREEDPQWTKDDQMEFEDLFCYMVCLLDLPFRMTSMEAVIKVFKKANPAVSLPTRDQLSTAILDRCFHKIEDEVRAKIAQSPDCFSLMSDASADVNSRPILNFILSNKDASYLLSSKDTSGSKKTGEYLANCTSDVIESFHLQDKIAGFISDNSANNIESWARIKTKYPHLFCYGCNDHALHLLSKDIIELKTTQNAVNHPLTIKINKTTTTCIEASKVFRNS